MKTSIHTTDEENSRAELLESYFEYARLVRKMAESTLKSLTFYLERICDGLNINTKDDLRENITFGSINRFIAAYSLSYGAGSCNWVKFALRSFLTYCHIYTLTASDLSSAVPSVRRRRLSSVARCPEESELIKLQSSLTGTSPSDLRDAALITLLLTYGVRGVQLRRLNLDDIDWEKQTIHFRAVKNGRNILQPLTDEAGYRLALYLKDARGESLFPEVFLTLTVHPHPLRYASDLSDLIHRRFKRAGVEMTKGYSYGSHAFRHALATRLVGNIPFKHLSDMLGHIDPDSTFIYSKVSFDELQEVAMPWPEETQL